jgi:hypothetical protein
MRMGLTRSLHEFRGAGTPAIRAVAARCLWACSAAAAMLLAAPGRCADEFPPPISNQPDQPAAPSSAPSAAEGKPGVEPGSPAVAGSAEQGATADVQPVEPKPERDVRIEQKHIGRRVSEVIVTPAGFTYHYSMTHLDDQDPGTTLLNPHPELSVPRFLRFDF